MHFRIATAILVVALGLSGCSTKTEFVPVASGDSAELATGIAVTGVGEILGEPDTLTFTVGVRLTRETVGEALADASAKATAVIDSLEGAGVDSDDIQTANLAIQPEFDWSDRGRRLLGYSVSNSVVARIRSVDSAGEIIDAAAEAGGDETIIDGIGFSLDDNLERLKAARERAWADAEAKAQQLAALAGVELGEAIRVNEVISAGSPIDFETSVDMAGDEGASMPILPGQVATRVVVAVVFAHS